MTPEEKQFITWQVDHEGKDFRALMRAHPDEPISILMAYDPDDRRYYVSSASFDRADVETSRVIKEGLPWNEEEMEDKFGRTIDTTIGTLEKTRALDEAHKKSAYFLLYLSISPENL